MFDYPSDNAEEFGVGFGGDGDRGKSGVFGEEPDGGAVEFESFDGELAIECSDDDIPIGGSEGAVYHEDVAIVYAGADHAFSACADVIGCGRVAYAEGVEVERATKVAHGRGGESGGYAFRKKGDVLHIVKDAI